MRFDNKLGIKIKRYNTLIVHYKISTKVFNIYKKYLSLGIIFIFIFVNINTSTSLELSESNLTIENVPIEKLDFFVKEGHGLIVEICNNGDIDAENIKLNVDSKTAKFVIIPKKNYEIPFLAAGESTELHIVIFGFSSKFLFDYPLVTIKVNSPIIKTSWKMLTIDIFGTRTKIIEELSSSDDSYEGYTLFGPEYSKFIYLLDMDGKIVYTWKSDYIQGFGTYLLLYFGR